MRNLTPEQRIAANESQKRYRQRYPEKVAAAQAASYRANAAYYNEVNKAWHKNNPDAMREIQRRYRARRDPSMSKNDYLRTKESRKKYAALNKERIYINQKRYRDRNPVKILARTRRYQTKKMNAMPKWANQFFMEEAYDLAARRTAIKCGGIAKWAVDHIVPLQSKLVCGLHVEHNLQVIPSVQNIRKGNRYWPDMPEAV